MTTETPRTDACPHCGAEPWDSGDTGYKCGSDYIQEETETPIIYRSSFCCGNENSQLKRELAASKAEAERLKKLLSDLLILTEKNYWNSTNYNQIKEALTNNK